MGIVIFSGTTEGREISDYLSSRQVHHIVCVATASGEAVMEQSEFADVHVGRLDEGELHDFLSKEKSECDNAGDCIVIDATHPYAEVITDNLKKVCDDLQIKYIRVSRESGALDSKDVEHKEGALYVAEADADNTKMLFSGTRVNYKKYHSAVECAKDLINEDGNILLATGSKELACYTQYEQLRDRLFVRVLPTAEAIGLCQKAGINEKHIIAMYGPHTKETNIAILKQFNIQHMVTKESGKTGGFDEKISAAQEAGIHLHIIKRPVSDEGISVDECIKMLSGDGSFVTRSVPLARKLIVKLVGIGPGSREMMTLQAISALENADVVFGAKRMIEFYDHFLDCGKAVRISEYLPERIIEGLEEILTSYEKTNINVVALFSGDAALFSGATKLYKNLVEWGKCDSIQIVPGISSFSAFATEIGVDLTYAHLESLHGKSTDKDNLKRVASLIKHNERVFLLMSGKTDFEVLQSVITDEFVGEIVIGYNIAYPDQTIIHTNAKEMLDEVKSMQDGLFICYVKSYEAKGTLLVTKETSPLKEPSLMIAAVSSGSGKTTITCGLLAEFKRRELKVKAYKCGPDYIDPMFHSKVIGVPSENLDSFFSGADYINSILLRNDWADISVIEGAMGLYDGVLGQGRVGSAYDVASKTDTPIVLIVDAHGMGTTLVSVIKGILADDDKKLIKGIILNRVSAHYYESISAVIENETGIRMLGFVPKLKDVNIDSRHLGLKLPNEIEELEKQIEILRGELEKSADIDGLIEIARARDTVGAKGTIFKPEGRSLSQWDTPCAKGTLCVTKETSPMAVAYDEVFCFYYEENFRLLKEAGVEIKFFSPLHDEKVPEGVAGILLGGGYPELKLAELSANVSMRNSIKEAYESGMPILAECGGFMYLHDAIEADGQSYEMVGAVHGKCFNTGKLCRFGYVDLNVADYDIKGHEFHYFDSTNNGTDGEAIKPGNGKKWSSSHYDEKTGSLLGYPHLYYGSCPKFIMDFVEHMRAFKEK